MNYAWLDENSFTIWEVNIPKEFKGVANFDTLSESERITHGFYPVVQDKPSYNPKTHYQTGPVATVNANDITATWTNVQYDLVDIKVRLRSEVRNTANRFIEQYFPLWKQINRNVPGRLTAEEVTTMDTYVDNIRSLCNTAETNIDAAADAATAASAADVDWPSV